MEIRIIRVPLRGSLDSLHTFVCPKKDLVKPLCLGASQASVPLQLLFSYFCFFLPGDSWFYRLTRSRLPPRKNSARNLRSTEWSSHAVESGAQSWGSWSCWKLFSPVTLWRISFFLLLSSWCWTNVWSFPGQHFGQRKRFFCRSWLQDRASHVLIGHNVLGVTLRYPHHVAAGKKAKNFFQICFSFLKVKVKKGFPHQSCFIVCPLFI